MCDNRTQKFPIDIIYCLTHILKVTIVKNQYFKETYAASRIYNYRFPNNSIFIQNIHACIIGFAKQSTISKILWSIWSKEVLALLILFREWCRLIVDNIARVLQRLFERTRNKAQSTNGEINPTESKSKCFCMLLQRKILYEFSKKIHLIPSSYVKVINVLICGWLDTGLLRVSYHDLNPN